MNRSLERFYQRFLLPLLAVLALIFSLVAYQAIQSQRQIINAEVERNLSKTVTDLARLGSVGLLLHDSTQLEEVLGGALGVAEDARFGAFLNAEGQIVASAGTGGLPVRAGPMPVDGQVQLDRDGPLWTGVGAVQDRTDRILGHVILTVDTARVGEALRGVGLRLFVLFLVGFVAVGGLAGMMLARVRHLASTLDEAVQERTAELAKASAELEETALFAMLNPNPVLRFDSQGYTIWANDAAHELLDIVDGSASLVDMSVLDADALSQCLGSDKPMTVTVTRAERSYQVTLRGHEKMEMGHAYFADITDQKRAEAAIQEARDQALEANRMKSEFLANMSHEIRTPLNGVLATASVLKEGKLDDVQRRQVNRILGSGDLLLALINDILDLAKIEANMMTLDREPFSLHQRIEEVIELQRPIASEKGIDIKLQVNEGCPDDFLGDSVRVYQVLSNLVGNAVKFTDQGSVEVSCEIETDPDGKRWVSVAIADSGIGIAPDRLHEVFEKFTQADGSTTRHYGGTGLGLAICAHLVTLMEGDISVDSELGEGSTFWFRLPLVTDEPGRHRAPEPAVDMRRVDRPPPGLRVLLVEDNPTNQEILIEMLTLLGYEVDLAKNGLEATQILDVTRHFIVLMDCEMPTMDGLTAAAEIRKREPVRVPIIALTAHASAAKRQDCLDAGMDDYLSKPIRLDALSDALGAWAGRSTGSASRGTPV